MRQAGHSDSSTTLRIYAHVMNTDSSERERLRAFIDGGTLSVAAEESDVGVT